MMSLNDLQNLKRLIKQGGSYKQNKALAQIVTEKMVRTFLYNNTQPTSNKELIKPLQELFDCDKDKGIIGIVE